MGLVYGFHRIAFVRLPLPSARVDDDRSAAKPFQDRVMRLFAVVDHFSRAGQNVGVRRRLLLARLPEARCFEQALPFKNDDIIHRNCLLGFHPLRAIESFPILSNGDIDYVKKELKAIPHLYQKVRKH